MQIKFLTPLSLVLVILIISCSKKQIPQHTTAIAVTKTTINSKLPATSIAVKKSPAAPLIRVIALNDSVAKKNFDGRLYYDVGGHRYWRNYKDGKYYLFNKSMYTDSAFKPH